MIEIAILITKSVDQKTIIINTYNQKIQRTKSLGILHEELKLEECVILNLDRSF